MMTIISVVSAFSLSDGGWWWPTPRPSPRRLAPPAARSSPRSRPLRPFPRSSASPGPRTPRAYPERRRAERARREICSERFSGTRSKGGRPRRPPRTETRGARGRRPRRLPRPRWPSRRATTMSPRALQDPSGCSARGGNWRMCVGALMITQFDRFHIVFVRRVALPPLDAPRVVLATSAQRQHQVKHRTALYVVVLRGPVVVHLLPAEDQSGGGEGEGDVSRGRRRFVESRKLFVEDPARRAGVGSRGASRRTAAERGGCPPFPRGAP